jgi:hypothetical protein
MWTSFEYGNTPLSFKEGGEFLEVGLEILKKDPCTMEFFVFSCLFNDDFSNETI